MRQVPTIMSFGEHLDELRKRLMWALLIPVPVFVVFLVFGEGLLRVVTAPLYDSLHRAGEPAQLIVTSPLEAFAAYVKVSAVATLVVAMPWVLYQVWLFVSPGLYQKERRFIYFLIPLSGLLTALGLVILYYVILPLSLFFLIEFGAGLLKTPTPTVPAPPGQVLPSVPMFKGDPDGRKPGDMWVNEVAGQLRVEGADGKVFALPLQSGAGIAQQYRVSEYVNLVFMMGLAFAVASQVPIVLMLISWTGLIDHKLLTQYRRHAIFGSVFLGALLPTQDPGSLILLGAMIYSLYELGIVLMKFMPASRVAQGWWKRAPVGTGAPTDAARQGLLPGTDGHLGDD